MKGIIFWGGLLSLVVLYTCLVVKEYRKWLKIKVAFKAEFGPDWYNEWVTFSILGDPDNWEFFLKSRINKFPEITTGTERPKYENPQNG